MDKDELIKKLENFKYRLEDEVYRAFEQQGLDYGYERLFSWEMVVKKFMKEHIPREEKKIVIKDIRSYRKSIDLTLSNTEKYKRNNMDRLVAHINSLIHDIRNDEYDFDNKLEKQELKLTPNIDNKKVFIVHGRDAGAKNEVARFIEKMKLNAIILDEQANAGRTLIQKFDENSNVGFAIIIYTGDDEGKLRQSEDELKPRARQNVVFEHGFLYAKLGKDRVATLVFDDEFEIPSDISGIGYISKNNWQVDLGRELKEAGYDIDLNDLT